MQNLSFDAGALVFLDRSVSPAVPYQIARLQDVSVDYQQEVKPLKDSNRFVSVVALGQAKMSIKAKTHAARAQFLAKVLGGTLTAGGKRLFTETLTAASHSVTATKAANFVDDLGMLDASGNQMTPVSALTAVGQYTVAAGVYTFYSGDADTTKTISYSYTDTAGNTVAVNNSVVAAAPMLECLAFNEYVDGIGVTHRKGLRFYAVLIDKLQDQDKQSDWAEWSIDATVYARASDGKVMEAYLG